MKVRKVTPLRERYWPKVAKAGPNDCWNWVGTLAKVGYGVVGLGRSHEGLGYSHRLAWEFAHGPIPNGLYVLHKCDNRRCCNPAHLFLGTHADNMRDAWSKGRMVFQSRPERMVRGSRHPNAKLSEDVVRRIRKLQGEGLSRREIANALGLSVSLSTVHYIASGKGWRDVS